jgi:dCMP deaminase
MRPHWDDVWLEVARAIAQRSLCIRAQVGVVIVDSENRIVSTGYNGPPAAFDHRDQPCNLWCDRGAGGEAGTNCPASHAEQNAFMAADRSSWQHGTLYVTGHVCAECTKLISNSGLSRVVVQPDDVDRSYRDYDDSYRFMRSMGIGVEVLEPYVAG